MRETRRAMDGRAWRIVAVLLAAAALAVPSQALAAASVPFKGADAGTWGVGGHDCGALFPVWVDTAGTATQLGRYAYVSQECVDLGDGTYAGVFVVTAASGDTMVGTYAGTFTVDGDGNIHYEQTNTVSGVAYADGSDVQQLSGSVTSVGAGKK
jgi:hypothetical protein